MNAQVEWWYGDAIKSILMLPQEYYRSFDLIIVDLETAVIDVLHGAAGLNIVDAALLFLAPNGVIARNHCMDFNSPHRFTKYSFDIYNVDMVS